MASIVIELQRDALNRDILVSDLLRKAFVVAKKLGLKELEDWVNLELNGYAQDSDIPEYRKVIGEIKAWNPYNNCWMPVIMEDPKEAEALSSRYLKQAISEIEDLENKTRQNNSYQVPFPKAIERKLQKSISFDTQVTLITQRTALVRILDAVKNIALNWSLKLEKDGILGDGMSFSEEEKKEVAKHSYNINNFYGAVKDSQIQQSTESSTQILNKNLDLNSISKFISELKQNLNTIEVENKKRQELEADIQTVESQIGSPEPKQGIVRESLNSIRRILESASGSAVGQLLTNVGGLFT